MRPKRARDGEAQAPERVTNTLPAWLKNAAVWVGAGLAIAVLVVLGVAVLPGWWASQIGNWVQGVFGRGVPIGLGTGALFTLLPLGVGVLAFRSGLTSKVRITLVVIGLLLLLPNVLTIAIALGRSDARSVLAITAPGFRGATVVGIGLVILALVAVLVIRRRSRQTRKAIGEAGAKAKQLSRERAQAQAQAETKGQAGATEKPDPAQPDAPVRPDPDEVTPTIVAEPPLEPRSE